MATKSFGGMNSPLRDNHSCMFGGHSKYDGNRVAMWTLLTEIDIGNSGDYTPTVRANHTICEDSIFFSRDNAPWHPVTLLFRICSELKWPAPCYELINEEISATKHTFTLECKLLKHRAKGVGLSKKKAKCAASKAILKKIKDDDSLKEFSGFICHQMSIYDKEIESMCPPENGNSVNATSELYKMCHSRRWPFPVYGLLSVEGPFHSRIFRVGCTMPGLTELVEGKGHSKKEAKHAASLALLDKIIDDMSSSTSSSCTRSSLPKQENEFEPSQKLKTAKNATSSLNELCMTYNWPHPQYEFLPEADPGSNRLFTVGCSLLGHSELGTGYTKKEAKHAASSALLLKIREYLEDSLPFFNYNSVTRDRKIKADNLSNSDLKKDAITALHELCASRNWPKPIYKVLLAENILENQKLFTIGCYVLGHTTLVRGTGNNKKKAKHAASQALLDKIMSSDGDCGSPLHLLTKNSICDLNQTFQDADK